MKLFAVCRYRFFTCPGCGCWVEEAGERRRWRDRWIPCVSVEGNKILSVLVDPVMVCVGGAEDGDAFGLRVYWWTMTPLHQTRTLRVYHVLVVGVFIRGERGGYL